MNHTSMCSVGGEAALGFGECDEGKLQFFDDKPEKRGGKTVIELFFFFSVFSFQFFLFFISFSFYTLFPVIS